MMGYPCGSWRHHILWCKVALGEFVGQWETPAVSWTAVLLHSFTRKLTVTCRWDMWRGKEDLSGPVKGSPFSPMCLWDFPLWGRFIDLALKWGAVLRDVYFANKEIYVMCCLDLYTGDILPELCWDLRSPQHKAAFSPASFLDELKQQELALFRVWIFLVWSGLLQEY